MMFFDINIDFQFSFFPCRGVAHASAKLGKKRIAVNNLSRNYAGSSSYFHSEIFQFVYKVFVDRHM